MAITVQFSFDTPWAIRIQDMVEAYPRIDRDEIIQALLLSVGKTWEDLTAKQKWKVIVLRDTMERLMEHEGGIASREAAQVIIDDIEDNFPLEIGAA